MAANESLEKLISAINKVYPDINMQSANYSSYIIKNISPSDCYHSIRNASSNQYHIAVTGAERMSIFPLITDYKYLATHDTAFKHKFTFKCSVTLYIPDMIGKANQVIKAYTTLATTLALKEKVEFYEGIRDKLVKELRTTTYKKTFCNMAYNERGGGQKQLEIGRSDDDIYFLSFRKLLFPNDKLIIVKRKNQLEYLFINLPDDVFKYYHLNEIDEYVEIPTTERLSLQILSNGGSKVAEAATSTDVISDAEGGIGPGKTPSLAEKPREYIEAAMKPEQIIFFGAPGTGKSYDIDKKISAFYTDSDVKKRHSVRVIFYPDYEYSDFVGALRPVRNPEKGLSYEFIPGPMIRVLAECFKNPSEVFFLVIEEINRGNAPAIFGDLFQLLDRDANGKSVYEINNEEAATWLQKETGYTSTFAENKIWFPPNLNILCSMNTADQNVFVLDTAFSRRFERVYVKIDFDRLGTLTGAKKDFYTNDIPIFAGAQPLAEVLKDTELMSYAAELKARGQLKRCWPTFALLVNRLIDIVNDRDGTEQISEDKKLGPFFASQTDLSSRKAFLNKVVYYLKQDVFCYVEQYFESPFQTIYDKYIDTGDLFALLKIGE